MPRRNPVKGKAKLMLLIAVGNEETIYTVTWLDPSVEIGFPAWRLTRTGGVSYDVILKPTGAECGCGDWVWCRANKDPRGCKHILGLKAVGLLRAQGEE